MAKKKEDEPGQEQLQEKVILYQLLQKNLEELSNHAAAIQQRFAEMQASKMAFEEFKKTKEGDEMLVPLGSGLFVKTRRLKDDKVMINVGANVVIRKGIEDSLSLLQEKEKEIEVFSERLREQAAQVVSQMNRIAEDVQKLQGIEE